MVAIKPIDKIVDKWVGKTAAATGDYLDGVTNPRRAWAAATIAAKDSWKMGVTKAAQEDRFAKGVTRAGDAKWQRGAITKGPNRWAEGVALAADDYRKGFLRIHAAIASASLPPRFAKQDPRNLERVKAMNAVVIAASKK